MRIALILALVALLVLAACGQEPEPNNQIFVGGTEGLELLFQEGTPPAVIYDNGKFPFSVAMVVRNGGEADVGPDTQNPFVQLKLDGINPTQWSIPAEQMTKHLEIPIRGAKKVPGGAIIDGELSVVSFDGLNFQPNMRGTTTQVIRSILCYDYQTFSTTQICIKDDIVETAQDVAICSIRGEKNPSNSGAPVHVTSLTQNPLGEGKIQINFQVEHVGQGQIFARAEGEVCDFSIRNLQNKNKVDVLIRPIEDRNYKLFCPQFEGSNQGTITLYQGAPMRVSCTIERLGPSEVPIFQDWLDIELRYRYGEFVDQMITIEDVSLE